MKHAREDYNRIQDPSRKIPDDEPVFLIRGQDECAPGTLEFWASLAESKGASQKIVDAARKQADLMRGYQAFVRSKVPDMPQGE